MTAKTDQRPSPPGEPVRKDNGFRYRPQYAVIVVCDDEEHHRRAFEELKAAGYKCRVVCV